MHGNNGNDGGLQLKKLAHVDAISALPDSNENGVANTDRMRPKLSIRFCAEVTEDRALGCNSFSNSM